MLEVKDLSIGYDSVLATVNLELLRGQKLGVIGKNGIGKSTFVKTLNKEIASLGGEFVFGLRSEIGNFDQQMAEYYSEKTLFEDFSDHFPRLNETEIRSALGAFLFSGEDVFKKISDLSGGERVRLALCKIFKKRPNVLILDEPTNHMDIVGKETLENMLCSFEGTVIFVSHDRYFVNKVADKLLVFEQDGAKFYPYGYEEYELVCKETEQDDDADKNDKKPIAQTSSTKKTFSTPLKDRGKKERRVKKLEQLIGECEVDIASLNSELEKPENYSDYVKISEIEQKLSELNVQLEQYSEEWLTLSEQLEQ